MLAISSGIAEVFILAGAAVLGALILGIGKAVMGLVRTRQTKKRDDDLDQRTLSEFFFDTPSDPRTRTPGKKGWTTKVDETLEVLTAGLDEVLREIRPDRNGRHNLRGMVERGAEAAGADVPTHEPKVTE